jgi:hypothetical protein
MPKSKDVAIYLIASTLTWFIRYTFLCSLFERVSGWLLFNANAAIFHLYYAKNKLNFNKLMRRSALYTQKCISNKPCQCRSYEVNGNIFALWHVNLYKCSRGVYIHCLLTFLTAAKALSASCLCNSFTRIWHLSGIAKSIFSPLFK